jgi:hypothetical protein
MIAIAVEMIVMADVMIGTTKPPPDEPLRHQIRLQLRGHCLPRPPHLFATMTPRWVDVGLMIEVRRMAGTVVAQLIVVALVAVMQASDGSTVRRTTDGRADTITRTRWQLRK